MGVGVRAHADEQDAPLTEALAPTADAGAPAAASAASSVGTAAAAAEDDDVALVRPAERAES